MSEPTLIDQTPEFGDSRDADSCDLTDVQAMTVQNDVIVPFQRVNTIYRRSGNRRPLFFENRMVDSGVDCQYPSRWVYCQIVLLFSKLIK